VTAPTLAVSAIVIADDSRILLVERGKPPGEGLWSLPGGKVERGETLTAAVAREVREETGLAVRVGPLVDVVERISDEHHYVILAHLAHPTGGSLTAGSDVRDARWLDDDAIAALPTTDGLADVIVRARARLPFPVAKAVPPG
jgi:8-oxo-dGTP diphosphatase